MVALASIWSGSIGRPCRLRREGVEHELSSREQVDHIDSCRDVPPPPDQAAIGTFECRELPMLFAQHTAADGTLQRFSTALRFGEELIDNALAGHDVFVIEQLR
jgi:hypothetical protein